MSHTVRIFFTKSIARAKIEKLLPNVYFCLSVQDFMIIPQSQSLLDEINMLFNNKIQKYTNVFNYYTESTELFLKEVSWDTPIAYFETDYHGGYGSQSSILFKKGSCANGPFHEDDGIVDSRPYPVNRDEWPINKILIDMGILKKNQIDEFDTINLSNYRKNDDFII